MTPLDRVLARLERVRRAGAGWSAACPAHADRTPSLSIREGDDGRALVHDHGGCPLEGIVAALGLEVRDLYPERDPTAPRRAPGPSPRERRTAERTRLRDALADVARARAAATAGVTDPTDAMWDRLAALAARETRLLAAAAADMRA